jgi:hypothetical protein
MADRTWRVPWKRLDLPRFTQAATEAAAAYAGVQVTVEAEDVDTHTAFFAIPARPPEGDELGGEGGVVELSLYDMDGDGILLSLEDDASDNARLQEDVDQLAEDIADALEAESVDL